MMSTPIAYESDAVVLCVGAFVPDADDSV